MYERLKRPPSGSAVCVATILLSLGFHWAALAPPAAVGDARAEDASNVSGELVYVPIYSSIFYENGKHTLEVAATLSIHNVNPDHPVTIVRADYHDTAGNLIKKYFDKPLVLNPLQTTSIVIDKVNTTGGTGANFLVQSQFSRGVTSPLIEAVMVNASSNLGIAFTTVGKVVRQTGAGNR
jgi:hypothetical protein